jgi:hypothetical protein
LDLQYNSFPFHCVLISYSVESSPVKRSKSTSAESRLLDQLSDELARIVNGDEFCDVTFVVGSGPENVSIQAHRVILAARSATFKSLFTTGMKETKVQH